MEAHKLSQREQNKQEKRTRIVDAAIRILSSDGIDALTMRRLADEAGVSSRTPYNLFDSKTDILMVIMMQAIEPLENLEASEGTVLEVAAMMQRVELMLQLNREQEAFYRSVHWSIMRSDDMEAKKAGRATLDHFIADHLDRALDRGELKADSNLNTLAVHISVLLASILGMWADSQLTLRESVDHIRHAWINSLLPHARGKALRYLRERQAAEPLKPVSANGSRRR